MAQPGLVSLHRAIKIEKVGVPAEGIGKDLVAPAVPFAPDLLGPRGRIGDQNGDVAVGARAYLLRALRALRAELGRLALPLGLHALIYRLAVLLGKVGAPDTHVDDGDAQGSRFPVELLADLLR